MAKKKAPTKLFSNFPTEVYLSREGGDTEDGFFLQWESKKDAAENAIANNSKIAIYALEMVGSAKVDYEVTLY